jgi:hypothetical protein
MVTFRSSTEALDRRGPCVSEVGVYSTAPGEDIKESGKVA